MSQSLKRYTARELMLDRIDYRRLSPQWQIPLINPVNQFVIPEKLVPIDSITRAKQPWKESECCVHAFRDDDKLEPVWRDVDKYIALLRNYQSVFMLDYSLLLEMPLPAILDNLYRRAFIAQLMQDAGLTVFPLASWATPNTYGPCFEWLPRESVVGVSNYGARRDPIARQYFMQGFREMLKTVRPRLILFYGTVPTFNFDVPEIIPYAPEWCGSKTPCHRVPYQPCFVWEAC